MCSEATEQQPQVNKQCTCKLKSLHVAEQYVCVQLALVQHKRQLLPRTFRLGPGSSIMIGGVGRFDVLDGPSATLYMTVYASMAVPCYMTKTDKLDAKCAFPAFA